LALPAVPKSGAEATALQTLARPPGLTELREASGLRRVYRRFSSGGNEIFSVV
jgi:DNA-binding phage protein